MKYIIDSADWNKMLEIEHPAKNADREYLIDKLYNWARDIACEEPNTVYGHNSSEFAASVKGWSGMHRVVGFVSYYAVPEKDEMEYALRLGDYEKLEEMAGVMYELEREYLSEENSDAVISEISDAVDAYLAALPDTDE